MYSFSSLTSSETRRSYSGVLDEDEELLFVMLVMFGVDVPELGRLLFGLDVEEISDDWEGGLLVRC